MSGAKNLILRPVSTPYSSGQRFYVEMIYLKTLPPIASQSLLRQVNVLSALNGLVKGKMTIVAIHSTSGQGFYAPCYTQLAAPPFIKSSSFRLQ
jgi:hypothetical protein